MSAKFACIATHQEQFAIVLMCRVLAVSTSGYYAAQYRAPSDRVVRDEQLTVQIRAAHQKSRRRYGAPRVHRELTVIQGGHVGKKRVARLMQRDGLRGRRPQRWVRTTESAHGEPVAPNTLDRAFAVRQVAACDRVWTSDITDVPTREGWLYLAVVLDLASRRVVGWAVREALERELVLAALAMALTHRQPAPGVLHHSDRGRSVRLGGLPRVVDGARAGGEHESARELLGSTPSPRVSSPRSRWSSCMRKTGARETRPGATSSSSSRCGTTASGGTPAWATAPRSSTRRGESWEEATTREESSLTLVSTKSGQLHLWKRLA